MTSGSAARALRRSEDDEVLAGLRAPRKHLPCRMLHEAGGAQLFTRLMGLDEYYLARTELALLRQHAATISHHVGPEARIVEIGSGEGTSGRQLLASLERPSSYVPVDVCGDTLHRSARTITSAHPGIEVQPVTADFTRGFDLPVPQHEWRRTLMFFPGSQVGTLEPSEARLFLKRLADAAGTDRLLLIGADGTRDPHLLQRAYDDEQGAAAAFDKHVLEHLNQTHGATFDPDQFEHRAVWNDAASRIELHLVSLRRQTVRIDDTMITFAECESIVTAHYYKHTPVALQAILASAGWRPRHIITATQVPYRLWLCEPLTWSR